MTLSSLEEQHYVDILKEECGAEVFCDYASKLIASGRNKDAILVCLSGLTSRPDKHRGRLILARAFFEEKMISFAVREISELLTHSPAQSAQLENLLKALSPAANPSQEPFTAQTTTEAQEVASVDFDIDILSELEKG